MSIDTPEAAGNGVENPGPVENQTSLRAVPAANVPATTI
jgi:hypothetical protein